jgi:hypothetical protein
MYCHWNEFPEADLRDFGLTKDQVDQLVRERFESNAAEPYDKRRRRLRTTIKISDGRRFEVEFTVVNDRPWIQSIELEPEEI